MKSSIMIILPFEGFLGENTDPQSCLHRSTSPPFPLPHTPPLFVAGGHGFRKERRCFEISKTRILHYIDEQFDVTER